MHTCSFRPLMALTYFGGNSPLSNVSITSVAGTDLAVMEYNRYVEGRMMQLESDLISAF